MRPSGRALLPLALLLTACASDIGASALAINDPLDLIEDVEGPLRLFVLPAADFICEATTGMVSPEVPDVGQGMFADAAADVTVEVMGVRARSEVQVPGGDYTVLVRGKGTDRVTGITDTFIATGCTPVTIGGGETVEIRVTLLPIVGMGVCGDGTFSPDEQCEDGNTADGDGCSATCRTEPMTISTAAGMQDSPALASAPGRRWVSTFDTGRTAVHIRLLEPDGSAVMTPSVLANDAPLSSTVTINGLYLLSDVAVANDGRIAVSFTNFIGGAGIRVAFFDANRTAMGNPVALRSDAGAEPHSSVAFASDGALLAVFEDQGSGSGLSGSVFPAGSTSAGPLFEVGESGAAQPSVASGAGRFAVAFTAGGDVFVQRFDAEGEPLDASPVAVLEDPAGTQDQPSVALLPDGRALVAWRDSHGDGAGTAIRARAFDAEGSPAGPPFVLNTTTSGDQSTPSVAASGETFLVAFQSGGSVRARVVSGGGDPLPNREQPPTTADFEVAASGTQPTVASGGESDVPWMISWTESGDIRGRRFSFP